jgi:hypothetical protein
MPSKNLKLLKKSFSELKLENLNKFELKSWKHTLLHFGSDFEEEILKIEALQVKEPENHKLQQTDDSKIAEIPEKLRKLAALENLLESKSSNAGQNSYPSEPLNQLKSKLWGANLSNDLPGNDASEDSLLNEELKNQILLKSEGLLHRAEKFNSKLTQDQRNLIQLENKLEDSFSKLQSRRDNIAKVTKTTWTTTILIWVSVLVAILAFFYMIIFMKLFSVRKVDGY